MSNQLNVTKGNDFGLEVRVWHGDTMLPMWESEELRVRLVNVLGEVELTDLTCREDGSVAAHVDSSSVSAGVWSVELRGVFGFAVWQVLGRDVLRVSSGTTAAETDSVSCGQDNIGLRMELRLARMGGEEPDDDDLYATDEDIRDLFR